MRRPAYLLILLLLVGTACTSGSGPEKGQPTPAAFLPEAAWAPRIHGPLHTDGTRIVDARGQDVAFRGINVHDLRAGAGNPRVVNGSTVTPGWDIPPQEQFENIQAWGFNSVRLAITWANLEPTAPVVLADGGLSHTYNPAYLAAVDSTVRGFTDRGIAVILQMAQNQWSPAFIRKGGIRPGIGMPTWLYRGTAITDVTAAKVAFFEDQQRVQEQYAAAWGLVAGRYAGDPLVVGADMMNEPYTHAGSLSAEKLHLDDLYAKIGAAIRSANPNILLMFQDSQDTGDGVWAVTHPPPFDGVVYTFHLYTHTWDPDGIRLVEDRWQRAERWGVPLWVGEFNAFGYGNNEGYDTGTYDEFWRADTQRFLTFIGERGISFTYSAYGGSNSVFVPNHQTLKPRLLPTLQSSF